MATATIISKFPPSGASGTVSLTLLPFPGVSARVGVAYSQSLQAIGGAAPYTYSISVGSLPAGLSLNSSTGAITGTPTTVGPVTFTAKVTDSASATATEAITIMVTGFTIASPPATGVIGDVYTGVLFIAGGTPPFTFAVTSGALPAGLSLSTSPGLLNGLIEGVPTAVGTFTFVVTVTDSLSKTASTPSSVINITAVGATGPVGEVTGVTATARYFNAASGGQTADECWQLIVKATPPSDPKWFQSNVFLCPFAVLAAPGPGLSGTTAIPSETSGYAGGTVQVYVTPWAVPQQITVASDGKTVTWTAGPLFNPALASPASGASVNGLLYCLVAGALNQITITGTTTGTLQTGVTPGTGITLATMEARFGLIQDSTANSPNGDTIIIDAGTSNAEAFTIQSLSQALLYGTGDWLALWTITRSPGAHPAHTGVTASVTYGGAAYSKFVVDVAGAGSDQWAGSIEPSQTQSVSSPYQMGAPTAYMVFVVGETAAFVLNPWIASTTPTVILGTVELQTLGSIAANRIAATSLGPGYSGGSGYPIQSSGTPGALGDMVQNGNFDQQPLGTVGACWALSGSASLVSPGYNGSAHCLQIAAGTATQVYQVAQNGVVYVFSVDAGAQYVMAAFVECDAGTTTTYGQMTMTVAWVNSSGSVFSTSPLPYPIVTSWTAITQVVTAPTGAVQALFYAANGGGAGNVGNYRIDDITFATLIPTGAGTAVDSFGNLISIGVSNNLVADGIFAITVGAAPPGSTTEPTVGDWCQSSAPNYLTGRVPIATSVAYVDSLANSSGGTGSAYTSGTNALKLINCVYGTQGIVCNLTECKPGQAFPLSVAACKPSSGGGGNLYVYVSFFNSTGGFVSGTPSLVTPGTSWGLYTAAGIAPSNASYVAAEFICSTAGTIWINNVVLYGPVGAGLANDGFGNQIVSTGGPLSLSGGDVVIADQAILNQYYANTSISNGLMELATLESSSFASGAAAGNITIGSLNADTVDAANGVFIQLVGGIVTAAIAFYAPEIVCTNGPYTISLNSAGVAVSVYNSTTGGLIDLTNGYVATSASGTGVGGHSTSLVSELTCVSVSAGLNVTLTDNVTTLVNSVVITIAAGEATELALLYESSGGIQLITAGFGNSHIFIDYEQVLAGQQTGWNAVSGSVSRGTLNTATATLSTVAETLGALITDLQTHGLING
jgi:hypothetical protein